MEIRISHIILFLTFFFTTVATAQRPDPNAKVDFVAESVKYLKKELTLDDFQAAAIRQIYDSEKENLTSLELAKDMNSHERTDKLNIITERIDRRIVELLSKEQVAKYADLQKKRKKGKL